jgi:O-antigen/teichoic acid export membrane protein
MMPTVTNLRNRLAGDIAVYGLFGAARHLISFLFLPLYVHILDTKEFGALDIIVTVVSLISLMILQFNIGYARYYYRERLPHEKRSYIKTVFCFFLILGLAVALFCSPLGYILGYHLLRDIPHGSASLALVTASFFPQVIVEFGLINMRLGRKTFLFGVINIVESALRGVLIIAFIGPLRMGLLGYSLGLLLANSLISLAVLHFVMGIITGGQVGIKRLKEIANFTFPTLPGVILSYVNQYGGRFVMLAFLTLEDIAFYALAMKIAKIMKMCVQSFRQAWLPAAMEQIYNPESSLFYARVFDSYAFITISVLMVVSVFSRPIVGLIAPASYLGASVLVPYLMAGVLISAASAIVDIGNQIAEKTKWISVATGVGSIVNLSISVAFAPRFGALAVATGFMFSAVASVLVLFLASLHNSRIPYRWRSLALVVIGIPSFILLIFR